MIRARWITMAGLTVAIAGVVFSQQVPPPGPGPGPGGEGGEEEAEPERDSGTLRPRPDNDRETEAWVSGLAAARPSALIVEDGPLLGHVMTPEGDRLYYYRRVEDVENDPERPEGPRYALYTVGPERSETRVAETGAARLPPLFLGDGRMLFTTCRYDLNDDGVLDGLDPSTLMVGNRDGGNLGHVATLEADEVPVAVWRDDSEVLLATADEETVNGWIVSLNLISGARENIVTGFNVELVLGDGRLLIERQEAPEADENTRPVFRWGQRALPEQENERPEPTLLDDSEHIIFDPKDGSEIKLVSPGRRARITVAAESSYFGHQERESEGRRDPRAVSGERAASELLILDGPNQRDTRSPSEKYDYQALGWIRDRGLLVIERGKLGSRLLLLDRSLNVHRIADFGLNADGFCVSADGLTVGWLELEDTDQNGYLQPWKDDASPHLLRLE